MFWMMCKFYFSYFENVYSPVLVVISMRMSVSVCKPSSNDDNAPALLGPTSWWPQPRPGPGNTPRSAPTSRSVSPNSSEYSELCQGIKSLWSLRIQEEREENNNAVSIESVLNLKSDLKEIIYNGEIIDSDRLCFCHDAFLFGCQWWIHAGLLPKIPPPPIWKY